MALFDFSNSQSILLASFNFADLKYSNNSLYYRLHSTQTMFVYILSKKQNGGRRRHRPSIPVICPLDNNYYVLHTLTLSLIM